MNATQLIPFLVETIKARIPVLVEGAPGIGKSEIMNAATELADADLIVTHPAIEDPTVPAGLPFIVDGLADFLPFGALRRARSAKRLTVWFADDIGQATPATQAAYMPLLDAARGNNAILGEAAQHIVFVAATNRRGDRAGVSGILEPVKSRFGTIVPLDVDLDSWCNWAIDHNVDPILIAFHRFKGGALLSDFKPTGDLTNSPSPRTWYHVNKLIALNLSSVARQAAIAGAVGEGAAVEFGAFEKSWKLLPNIDQILIDPSKVHNVNHWDSSGHKIPLFYKTT